MNIDRDGVLKHMREIAIDKSILELILRKTNLKKEIEEIDLHISFLTEEKIKAQEEKIKAQEEKEKK